MSKASANDRRGDVIRGPLVPRPAATLPATAPRAPAGAPLSVHTLVKALLLWWKIALPVGVVAAAVGVAVVLSTFERKYTASAWVRIYDNTPYIAFESRDSGNRGARYVNTQIQMIQSPIILAPVVGKLETLHVRELVQAKDRVDWLAKNIVVRSQGNSELYTVSFTSVNPKHAADTVNTVVDEYIKNVNAEEARWSQDVLGLLEEEKSRRESEVKRLREAYRTAVVEAGGKDPFAGGTQSVTLQQDPLGELQKTIATVTVDIEVLKARIAALKETIKKAINVSEDDIEKAIEANPEVNRLQWLVLAGKTQMKEAEETLRPKTSRDPNDPRQARVYSEQAKLEEQVAQDEKLLAQVHAAARKDAESKLRRSLEAKRNDQLAELELDLQARVKQKEMLEQQKATELAKAKQVSGETAEIRFKKAELDQAQQVLDRISNRLVTLQTEQRAPARVKSLYRAEVPTSPIELYPFRRMGLAGLGCLFLPFALAILWERLIRRINESKDLESETHLTVVGEVPRLPRARRNGRESNRALDEILVFEESINSLRTRLTLSQDLQEARVLSVTSAASGEGKTSVAISLASSLARATGEPILLIDGDMRSPDVHGVFDIPLEPGLAEVLQGKSRLDQAVVRLPEKNLDVLPAGRLSVSPHRILGSDQFSDMLRDLAARYRYIVVDTPPVLAAAESMIVAKRSDLCLVCAMRNVSRGDQVRKACELLAAADTRIFGAVLNGVSRTKYGYHRGIYRYGEWAAFSASEST